MNNILEYNLKMGVKGKPGLTDVPHRYDLSKEATFDWALAKGFKKFADMVLYSGNKIGASMNWQTFITGRQWSEHRNALYIILIDEWIAKIGGTTTGLSKRWTSYHNGRADIREDKGTGSPTNYNVMEALKAAMRNGRKVEWYFYPTPVKKYPVNMFGKKDMITADDFKSYEKELTRQYEETFFKKPFLSTNK